MNIQQWEEGTKKTFKCYLKSEQTDGHWCIKSIYNGFSIALDFGYLGEVTKIHLAAGCGFFGISAYLRIFYIPPSHRVLKFQCERTDTQTHGWTFRPIERIRPEGRCFKNHAYRTLLHCTVSL